jgi:predicted nucleotidyltransferase
LPLPVQSIRARPEHRDVLQAVADRLRRGEADTLRRSLREQPERPVGPFRSEAAALGFLRDRLVSALRPRMIWLFGSRARGDAREDSDFDLFVVLPDELPPAAYSHAAVAEPLVACGLGYDVVPCRWSTFVEMGKAEHGLVPQVLREGRLLYQDRDLRGRERAA